MAAAARPRSRNLTIARQIFTRHGGEHYTVKPVFFICPLYLSPVRKSKHKSWWRSRNRAQLHLHYRRFVSHAPSTGSHCVLLMGISTTRHKKIILLCEQWARQKSFHPFTFQYRFFNCAGRRRSAHKQLVTRKFNWHKRKRLSKYFCT